MKIDKELFEIKLLRLGFREVTSGTAMLRYAVEAWEPGMMFSKELYPEIAKLFDSTASRGERAMRHAIETAFERGDYDTINSCFGYSLSADKSKPTVGEFVSRMARVCACED